MAIYGTKSADEPNTLYVREYTATPEAWLEGDILENRDFIRLAA
jgi:hypothetical protein